MIKSNKRFVWALAALTLPMLVAGPSEAADAHIGAAAGTAYYSSDLASFQRTDYNRITLVPGTTGGHYWNIELPYSSTGAKSFIIYGKNPGSSVAGNQTSCAAIVTNVYGGLSSWTGHYEISSTAGGGVSFGPLYAYAGMGVQVECYLQNTAIDQGYVTAIDYTW